MKYLLIVGFITLIFQTIMNANVVSYNPETGIYVVDQCGASKLRNARQSPAIKIEKMEKKKELSKNKGLCPLIAHKSVNVGLLAPDCFRKKLTPRELKSGYSTY